MNNGMNGMGVPMLGRKPQRVEWDNNEASHRLIASQIAEQVRNSGGGLPVGDPGSYLALMLVLDRLAVLERKLDHVIKLSERKAADGTAAV